MAYCTQAQIQTEIPASDLVNALDDDRNGVADTGLLDSIIALSDQEIDGLLGALYEVPFADPPALVRDASFIFTCERLARRRGVPDEHNPYGPRAKDIRARLQLIADGKSPLDLELDREVSSGAVITEQMTIDDTTR